MEVIVSHMNLDFDGLASMVAAKKLYPDAKLVVTDKLNMAVKQFLAIYRDKLDLTYDQHIPWEEVDHVILADVASVKRVGPFMHRLKDDVSITIYDHHPPQAEDIKSNAGKIEQVGATVTLLIEELQRRGMSFNMLEATLFGLGLYTDTGYFSYSNTTSRDLQAASYLLEQGMSLELINRFADDLDYEAQYGLFNQLLNSSEEHSLNGLNILICSYVQERFQGGLSTITRKLMETTGADAVLSIVDMQKNIYIVGRASSKRIDFLPLLKIFGGGGHEQAASATIKKGELQAIINEVSQKLNLIIKPAITARAIMVSPVKTISPQTTIEEAAQLMYRYGHSGFPVVENDQLVGIISRRDLDKATRHGLGHAPVKAYMSASCKTIKAETSLEEIQQIMIKHDVGRLPVIENGKLLGIISRTNVIEVLHNGGLRNNQESSLVHKSSLIQEMQEQFPANLYNLLQRIGEAADQQGIKAYLIGGIVRDLLLNRSNEDIDIVVEGNGISFAKSLAQLYGGEVKVHDSFGTSTWKHESGIKIDVTSSRFEYYEHPAALPTVEHSHLREDLFRRDFTINAMAIQLNQEYFGEVIDFFNGREDLATKRVRILHNLSFVEDPTRIIRAVRFETRFGFNMDEHTLQLAKNAMDRLRVLSKARIMNELSKLFSETQPLQGLNRLLDIGLWQVFIEEKLDGANILKHAEHFEKSIGDVDLDVDSHLKSFIYTIFPLYINGSVHPNAVQLAQSKQEIKFLNEIRDVKELWSKRQSSDLASLHQLYTRTTKEAILFFFTHPTFHADYPLIIDYLQKRDAMPKLLEGEDLIKEGVEKGPLFSKLLLEVELSYFKGEVKTKADALKWLKNVK